MTVTITHVYETYSDAESAVEALEAAGFTQDQVSVAGHKEDGREDHKGEAPATGATIGGLSGASAGLLASLGLIAIPGIGPLVAAGAFATTLAGAGAGAVAGGLAGALIEHGIPKDQAPAYAETVRRGGTLVSVRSEEAKADQAEAILQRYHPIDLQDRVRVYQGEGWTMRDEEAPLYTEEQRKLERERFQRM
jgi:uncharacterized membrane protein